jgi:hypothetical protein
MADRRNDLPQGHKVSAAQAAADAAAEEGADAAAALGEEDGDDDRPLGHRRSGGGAGFGTAIAGIMHGIDADIFRDPAAIRRMERDRTAVARTADGTVVGIGLPDEDVNDDDGVEPA